MRRLLASLLGLVAGDGDAYDESHPVLAIELWRRQRRFERHVEGDETAETGVSVPDTPGARHAHGTETEDERK